MAAAAVLQKRKIAVSPQCFDRSPRNLARLCSWILLTVPTVKISKNLKIQDGGGRHFEKWKNHLISATV